jgi:hypothetical protein
MWRKWRHENGLLLRPKENPNIAKKKNCTVDIKIRSFNHIVNVATFNPRQWYRELFPLRIHITVSVGSTAVFDKHFNEFQ